MRFASLFSDFHGFPILYALFRVFLSPPPPPTREGRIKNPDRFIRVFWVAKSSKCFLLPLLCDQVVPDSLKIERLNFAILARLNRKNDAFLLPVFGFKQRPVFPGPGPFAESVSDRYKPAPPLLSG